MTLLSIREQAGGELANAKLLVEALSYEHKDEKALDEAWDDHDKALILATRDAIARQVREAKGDRLGPFDGTELSVFAEVATFIEEMRCE